MYLILFLQPRYREKFWHVGRLALGWGIVAPDVALWLARAESRCCSMSPDLLCSFFLSAGSAVSRPRPPAWHSASARWHSCRFMACTSPLSVLVGERLGENRDDLAASVTMTSLQIALGYMLLISLLYFFVPGIFLTGFFSHSTTAASEPCEVRDVAAMLLKFVAGYNCSMRRR